MEENMPYTPRYRRGVVPANQAIARDLYLDAVARVKRELENPAGKHVWIYKDFERPEHSAQDLIYMELLGLAPEGTILVNDLMLLKLDEAVTSGRRVIVYTIYPPPQKIADNYLVFKHEPPIPIWGTPVTQMGFLVGNP